MLRVHVLVSSPVQLAGLVQGLANAGITATPAKCLSDREILWSADAVLIDTDVLRPSRDLLRIAEMAQLVAVFLLNDTATATECEAYLEAGAVGVISKRESVERLVAVLRAVMSGRDGAHGRDIEVPAARERTERHDLSAREQQVLFHISRGLTHRQVATRLGISPHTVDTYVKRIRAKLGVGNKAELTRVALLRRMTAVSGLPAGTADLRASKDGIPHRPTRVTRRVRPAGIPDAADVPPAARLPRRRRRTSRCHPGGIRAHPSTVRP